MSDNDEWAGLPILRRQVIKGMAALSAFELTAARDLASPAIDASDLATTDDSFTAGILGEHIATTQDAGADDCPTFAEKAEKLLVVDKCASVYGCYTSASPNAVLLSQSLPAEWSSTRLNKIDGGFCPPAALQRISLHKDAYFYDDESLPGWQHVATDQTQSLRGGRPGRQFNYDCPSCGSFTAFRSLADHAKPASCDECAGAAPRAILNAPAIAGLGSRLRCGIVIKDRSQHELRRTFGSHPSGCGGGSTSERLKHDMSGASPGAAKFFARRQPCVISRKALTATANLAAITFSQESL